MTHTYAHCIESLNFQNKMTASNLAVVWAPNIFQKDGDVFEFSNITSYVEVMNLMIKNTPQIFEVILSLLFTLTNFQGHRAKRERRIYGYKLYVCAIQE